MPRLLPIAIILMMLPNPPARAFPVDDRAPRLMEHLDRGGVAVRRDDGSVFVSWRLLATDPEGIAFDVFRSTDGGPGVKLNRSPLAGPTGLVDTGAPAGRAVDYLIEPLPGHPGPDGTPPLAPEPPASVRLAADAPVGYIAVPLRTPDGYTPNDASVGDLDGDGRYEIVLHQAVHGRDNSQRGRTGEPILEAYRLDGSMLWRINLGQNIREGAHYTQFLVYDLDSDGRAEVMCKTADGTIDGAGRPIGNASADWRNADGYVLDGPEFLTVFDGLTGRALATVDYQPARGRVADWGDKYGNRVDRFLAGVAYLDGLHPSAVFCRGYYTRTVLVAWDWRGGRLERRWTFDSDARPASKRAYRGQGNHNLAIGDVDNDGRDEIVYGACCIDDDGKGLYSTGLGHGDAIHLSDIDPDRPGLEVFDIHEKPRHPHGAEFRDARTGALIWSKPSPDVGRGVAMDI
ncbi:MAG: rhamnogalacturonan lyase family protein, partial [Isosphaeraceae bacterium]